MNAARTTPKAIRKSKMKSTAAGNNSGEKHKVEMKVRISSRGKNSTNLKPRVPDQMKIRNFQSGISDQRTENPEVIKIGEREVHWGTKGTEFEKAASCMARLMKDMQYATSAELAQKL